MLNTSFVYITISMHGYWSQLIWSEYSFIKYQFCMDPFASTVYLVQFMARQFAELAPQTRATFLWVLSKKLANILL